MGVRSARTRGRKGMQVQVILRKKFFLIDFFFFFSIGSISVSLGLSYEYLWCLGLGSLLSIKLGWNFPLPRTLRKKKSILLRSLSTCVAAVCNHVSSEPVSSPGPSALPWLGPRMLSPSIWIIMELVNHSNDSDLPLLCATSHSVTDLNRLQDKEPFLDKWASSGLSRGRMEMWERIYHSGGFLRASSAAVILDSQQCRLREPKSGPSLGSPRYCGRNRGYTEPFFGGTVRMFYCVCM